MNRLVLAILLGLFAISGVAQQYVPEPVTEPVEEQPAEPEEKGFAAKIARRKEKTKAALNKGTAHGTEATSAYNQWVLAYTKEAYVWHQKSTVMIFFVVVIVVLSGIVLAAWQLQSWIRRVKAYDEILLKHLADGTAIDQNLVTGIGQVEGGSVELKSGAMGVSSPYVGVIILGLSMGFFLAYLLYVYPIVRGP